MESSKIKINLVWFKRDLRVFDHEPLLEAQGVGLPILGFYCYEPSVINYPDFSGRHLDFINESLKELKIALEKINIPLKVFHAELEEVLENLGKFYEIMGVYAHEETGNKITFDRDLRIQSYLKNRGVLFKEFQQFAVVRRLKSRDLWTDYWGKILDIEPLGFPKVWDKKFHEEINFIFNAAPSLTQLHCSNFLSQELLNLKPDHSNIFRQQWYRRQIGGEEIANRILSSFLGFRSVDYKNKLSSPVSAFSQCSRLSPYLSYGNISMRVILKALKTKILEINLVLKSSQDNNPETLRLHRHLKSLSAFQQRLYWHCHFIQKLEDEPEMEFHALSRSLDGLRDNNNLDYLAAWKEGETGFALIDACMKALRETGWINFRMRAMLCSFATYHLWLDWRPVAHYLACLFIDYEPGIHYPQIQMQSGVTGINAIRIYNPEKQLMDQDPHGLFCEYWLGQNFQTRPKIINLESAALEAKNKIFEARKKGQTSADLERILIKHGSRKYLGEKSKKQKSQKDKKTDSGQIDLFD